MLASLPISFESPAALIVAAAMLLCATVVALLRRPALPIGTWALVAAGAALIAIAAGLPHARRQAPASIAVIIDVSPSTRPATYHDPSQLSRRIAQLLGPIPYRIYAFSGEGSVVHVDEVDRLPAEIPADETIFAPPLDAKALLLFSDARFAQPLPAVLPPTYVVIDPALERSDDGRVKRLELRGTSQSEIAATVEVDGNTPRTLEIVGPHDTSVRSVGPGRAIVMTVDPGAKQVRARLNTADAWPENDSLELVAPPPARFERCWVTALGTGQAPPDQSWRRIEASSLTADSLDYLSASIIALDDVPADAIAPAAQQRLQQYVRDLGGGLLILGGEHAFAAGGYIGTPLDALSPLSSAPPRPSTHWILLADASGSMASPAGAGSAATRWQAASEALLNVIPLLPPNDQLSTGSFARELRWWTSGRSVRETASTLSTLPPHDLEPRGPTNLQAALEQIASGQHTGMPTELLILSDADATIERPRELAERLSANHVRVHLLATAPIREDNLVRTMVEATGGKVIAQPDAARWTSDLKQLLRAAAPERVQRDRISLSFDRSLNLPARELELWNRTWPKENVDSLASARSGKDEIVMVARRADGLGRVVAAAFQPTGTELSQLLAQSEQPPRDPRFLVTWMLDPTARVTVDAVDRAATQPYINALRPMLVLGGDGAPQQSIALRQTAPGRYEASIPDLRSPRIATLIVNDRVVDRAALVARYPREFDAIGNDRAAMRQLAERSGGRVIEPNETTPISVRWPPRQVDLTSMTATVGAALVALGVIWWRRST